MIPLQIALLGPVEWVGYCRSRILWKTRAGFFWKPPTWFLSELISQRIALGSQSWIHYKQPDPKPIERNGKNYWPWQASCQAETKARLQRRLPLVLQSASQTASLWAQPFPFAPARADLPNAQALILTLLRLVETWRNFFKVSIDTANGKSEWSQTSGFVFRAKIWKREAMPQSWWTAGPGDLRSLDYSSLVFPRLLFICCGIRYCR